MNIKRLNSTTQDFWPALEHLLAWESVSNADVNTVVHDIIAAVRIRGDEALLEYTQRFDRVTATHMSELEIPAKRLQAARAAIPAEQRSALERAAERVRMYHQHQKQISWSYTEADGTVLGQQVTALDRVGLYVPGGKAAYPSSVLMNAIPAKVAGVRELIMVVPTPGGIMNELVFAAAAIAGVDRVFTWVGRKQSPHLPTVRRRCRRSTKSSDLEIFTSPPPSVPYLAKWAST